MGCIKMQKYFDCNLWVEGYEYKNGATDKINELEKKLKKNNIDKAILTNKLSLSYDWEIGNSELIENSELQKKENIFFSAVIVPELFTDKNLEKYMKKRLKEKARIIRIFPKSHLFYINDFYMNKVYDFLSNYRIPLMIDLKQLDITSNKSFAIWDLKDLLSRHKGMPVIMECSLKQLMFSRLFYPLLAEYENLYIELSNLLLIDQIEDIAKRFGSHRIIFGSNYPNLDLEISAGRLMLSDLPEKMLEDIAYKNLEKILRRIKIG